MTTTSSKDWAVDFGLENRRPPSLFTSKDELTPATPQAHLLRRAFGSLELDGVLCADNSPLVYFKQVKRITADLVYRLHSRFWNHGGAPVLVLIADAEVHVYSGMSRPGPGSPTVDVGQPPSHVETLERVAEALRAFLTAVESGDYFRRHQKSFDPAQRVDRDLLDNLHAARQKLGTTSERVIPAKVLDALLCRLVFTCYLFDREVIGERYLDKLGIRDASHLRDVLAFQPRERAKTSLYRLFGQLGKDFNGDLFSDDLDREAEWVLDDHVKTLRDFFHGTSVKTGQGTFWPYDFAFIPIETISAIYERFLKADDEKVGAFYTPRFLAEVVLDMALADTPTLLGKRSLDPACGSGIFLVGLFNRIAEEWKQANPRARNDTKARELMRLLQTHLFGVDVKETACRITAFSLYLAYLDQLSPRDIQELQEKKRALPGLIAEGGNIQCADFFARDRVFASDVDIVIGNPPWGSIATPATPAGKWCAAHGRLLCDSQIAVAFVWKAAGHLADGGKVCFVLPTGLLFNHSPTAVRFQRAWVESHAIDRVLNLADLRFFLFEKAIHPALVVRYEKAAPKDKDHRIDYWTPKADWTVTTTEVITIAPQDRTSFTVGEVLRDLAGPDAPQIWKRRFWASSRDQRLLDRLSLYSRLRDHVRRPTERASPKPWIMAVGFQPVGDNDDPEKAECITLPSRWFIKATAPAIDLFLLTRDCQTLDEARVAVRSGSNKNTEVFRAPHVLMAKGITSTAYADFPVSFQDALRGIHGPKKDRELLMFLAAYLRSNVGKYYLFHTCANWGIYRPEVHVQDVLRVPFPLPDQRQRPSPERSWEIIRAVADIMTKASKDADRDFADRPGIIRDSSSRIEPLVEEYFDILPLERLLVEDTIEVSIKSIQPTQTQLPVETVKATSPKQLQAYCDLVCELLNGWAKRSGYSVRGTAFGSDALGVALAVFEKVARRDADTPMDGVGKDMLAVIDSIRQSDPRKGGTLDLVRGVMAFFGNRLYVVKPIGQRQWTPTAAMNDADEIAGTILMRARQEDA